MILRKESMSEHISPVSKIPYTLIFSKRKTLTLRIGKENAVQVLAPMRLSIPRINTFVDNKSEWIRSKQRESIERELLPVLSDEQKKMYGDQIRKKAVSFLDTYVGMKPNKVYIRFSSSRWGTCSSLGNISLNGYLALLPDDLFLYVILHELTHLEHMNHGREFWLTLSQKIDQPKTYRDRLANYRLP